MTPSSTCKEFNELIQRLSKVEYRNNWFEHDRFSTEHGDEIGIARIASTVELQQLISACLSGHKSLELINKQLERAYIFAMSESAACMAMTRLCRRVLLAWR
jgi:hypothetical protein